MDYQVDGVDSEDEHDGEYRPECAGVFLLFLLMQLRVVSLQDQLHAWCNRGAVPPWKLLHKKNIITMCFCH